jgi:hypothetical protein
MDVIVMQENFTRDKIGIEKVKQTGIRHLSYKGGREDIK